MQQTRRLTWILASGLAVLVTPTTAGAQVNVQQIERDARNVELEGRPPFAGLSETGALSRIWSVNTFYAVFRGGYPNQTVFWVVRREGGNHAATDPVVWADSRSCPAVERVLIDMEKMPAVRPDAIRLGQETDVLGIVMDGTHHTFWNRWARSGPQEATVSLEISGNVNSPIARWWAKAWPQLADCWTETQPS